MIDIWERQIVSTDETGGIELARLRFLHSHRNKPEVLTFNKVYTVNGSLLDVADICAAFLRKADSPVRMTSSLQGHIAVQSKNALIFIVSHNRTARGAPAYEFENAPIDDEEGSHGIKRALDVNIIVTGPRELITATHKHIDSNAIVKHEREGLVRWWYNDSAHGVMHREITLPTPTTTLIPELYPDLGQHPREFLKDYLQSPSSILLLAGPPGTGKTTLLRHLICDFRLTTHVLYDESLMNTDQIFQNFLFDKASDMLVIEDADTILTSREMYGNQLMARFLSITDGLIKLPNKKVVFTTNISDFNRVDSALLRPGRCFKLTSTRELDLSEAQALAKALNIREPTQHGSYTLAEIFNQAEGAAIRKLGF